MSITATIAAFQTRHAAIAGVTTAPTIYPSGINAADLPLMLTDALKGKTEWETHGGDAALETRGYRVRFFCLPTGLGAGIDQGKQQAISVLDAVLASYRTNPTLSSTVAIRIEVGVEDTGPRADMQYTDPETRYWGFELVVPVEERYDT
jgi:hypothetical protein